MGEHGPHWMQCSYCAKWGKCTDEEGPGIAPLTDVDGIGVLCDTCNWRTYPPHYDFLHNLLCAKFTFAAEVSGNIAEFAYAACARYNANTLQYPDDTGRYTLPCPCGNCKTVWNAWGWVCPLENGRAGLGTQR